MKYATLLFTSLLFSLLIVGCGDSAKTDENVPEQNIPTPTDETLYESAEAYITSIDEGKFTTAKSLYYSRPDGASVEVELFLNDSNQVVKLVEYYTPNEQSSILTNKFYYKDGVKYASKEYYEDKNEYGSFFVERVSYYDDNGKPKTTKRRTASFEDALVDSSFEIAEKRDCSDKRAFQVLNQEGEYVTNFQGIVQDQHMSYIIVGENKQDGYSSSLAVQKMTATIQHLAANESAMIGTPLEVEFSHASGDMGFTFQALITVKIVKK